MENLKTLIPHSPHSTGTQLTVSEPLVSTLLYDISQQVQSTMEGMLKLTSEVDRSSSEITEEIRKCGETVDSRQRLLEEEKESVQKAAYAVLDMLDARGRR
ncbi:hypothetical protein ZOSMA_5G01270 [Zostera marina]|uniref:Uncharacterized protein n=1 Tax=Zostera marina TaxID=29655 RepID=A0A0K9NW39_ZOSMR|nr:hypothetical protein ZOSMA_5G01270 [Zostera marina]